METKLKAEIITDFAIRNGNDDKYDDFFSFNDLGIPLAVSFNANLCTLNQDGVAIIDETYEMLCAEVGAKVDEDYDSLDDLLNSIEEE